MANPEAQSIFETGPQPTVLRKLGHFFCAQLQSPVPSEHFTEAQNQSANGDGQATQEIVHPMD